MIAFHVTPARNLKKITAGGLDPACAVRVAEMGETESRTYLFTSYETLEGGMGWYLDRFDEDEEIALIAVDTGGLEVITFDDDPDGVAPYEIAIGEKIDPARLTVLLHDIGTATLKEIRAECESAQAHGDSPETTM